MQRILEVTVEHWPIAGRFAISRGARSEAVVVVASIREEGALGRGESVPYPRYGETPEHVTAAIEAMAGAIADGLDRAALLDAMPAGPARNAIDCALWDLEAKRSGKPASTLAGVGPLRPVETAFTISIDAPEAMAEAARRARDRPLLKIKLGGDGDPERLAAVREAAPAAKLIVDANEGWSVSDFAANMEACTAVGVMLVEQPLPAGDDALLADVTRPVPVCADESLHVAADLEALRGRYDAVNIKLDKTGGLTEALATASAARALGFKVMVGCMVSTSLAMAPAMLLAQTADFVDLDGPLLLAADRKPGLVYRGSMLSPPAPELWG
jgi:L-alanine-DL-glutamate epimerase-like enolase superfamily enzyme